jgi:hypothetical protein
MGMDADKLERGDGMSSLVDALRDEIERQKARLIVAGVAFRTMRTLAITPRGCRDDWEMQFYRAVDLMAQAEGGDNGHDTAEVSEQAA